MPLNPVPNYLAALDSLPDPTSSTYTDDDGFELDLLLQKLNAILELLEAKVGITDAPAQDTPVGNTVLASAASGKSSWRKIVPADVTDRTRQKWLGATQFMVAGGSPTLAVVTALNAWPYWALDAASQESITTSFDVPQDYASGTFTVKVFYWTPNSNAGNIMLGLAGRPIGDTNPLDSDVIPASPGTTCAAPGATNTMKVITITAAFGVGIVAGEASQLQLLRYAADAGDTYASDVHIGGLMLSYTADS